MTCEVLVHPEHVPLLIDVQTTTHETVSLQLQQGFCTYRQKPNFAIMYGTTSTGKMPRDICSLFLPAPIPASLSLASFSWQKEQLSLSTRFVVTQSQRGNYSKSPLSDADYLLIPGRSSTDDTGIFIVFLKACSVLYVATFHVDRQHTFIGFTTTPLPDCGGRVLASTHIQEKYRIKQRATHHMELTYHFLLQMAAFSWAAIHSSWNII